MVQRGRGGLVSVWGLGAERDVALGAAVRRVEKVLAPSVERAPSEPEAPSVEPMDKVDEVGGFDAPSETKVQ